MVPRTSSGRAGGAGRGRALPSAAEARRTGDYKNVGFLEQHYLSAAGRLLPRWVAMQNLPLAGQWASAPVKGGRRR